MFARLLSGLDSRYLYRVCAQSALAEPVVIRALENSLRKTMMIEEEFVRKLRKASAGLFLEICDEIATRNFMKVFRHVAGKENSIGKIGLYHQLYKLVLETDSIGGPHT